MMVVVILDSDGISLRDDQVLSIDLAEDVWFQDIGRRPCGV
jgi:hypothetical protein